MNCYPDGTNTYFDYVIGESGSVRHLHVERDERYPVEVEDATDDFVETLNRNKQRP